jgi:hypothetical protein
MDPSDVARRLVESNLRVVWRGSQWVNLSIYMYVFVKCGGIVGGGGTTKAIPFKVFVHVSKYLQFSSLTFLHK